MDQLSVTNKRKIRSVSEQITQGAKLLSKSQGWGQGWLQPDSWSAGKENRFLTRGNPDPNPDSYLKVLAPGMSELSGGLTPKTPQKLALRAHP